MNVIHLSIYLVNMWYKKLNGEVQTPVWNMLHLYQWTSIISVIIGILMTVNPVHEDFVYPEFGCQMLVAAIPGGLFTSF